MKPIRELILVTGASLALIGGAHAAGMDPDSLGLEKSSVYSAPTPIRAGTQAKAPGQNPVTPGYFSEAPPTIPHRVEGFLPIKAGQNMCLGCHQKPDQIGQSARPGVPTPMPASHYTDLRRAPDKVTHKLIGARYICTQCHAPQTDAPPLVVNTYRQ